MSVKLNWEQRKALSSFFISIAVAWFIDAFVSPQISPEFNLLTLIRYLVNMIGALILALMFLKEE